METIQTLSKHINLTELNSKLTSKAAITLDELNNEKPLLSSDVVWFNDIIFANYEEDCANKNAPAYAKAMMLMKIVKDKGISSKSFRKMIIDFIAGNKFKKWTVADVMEYYNPTELRNEDWYKKQLATTEFNPEHFEIFLVEGKKYYCYKADADKVKLSDRVQLYRPKRIERAVKVDEVEVRTDYDKIISEKTLRILELEAEVERLKAALMRKEK